MRERCSSFLSLEQFAFSLLEKWTGLGLREVNSKNRSSSVVPPHDTGSNSTSHRIQQGKRRKTRATRSIAYSRWRNLGVTGSSTFPPWTRCFHSLLFATGSHFCVRSWIFLLLQIRIGSVRWKRSLQGVDVAVDYSVKWKKYSYPHPQVDLEHKHSSWGWRRMSTSSRSEESGGWSKRKDKVCSFFNHGLSIRWLSRKRGLGCIKEWTSSPITLIVFSASNGILE